MARCSPRYWVRYVPRRFGRDSLKASAPRTSVGAALRLRFRWGPVDVERSASAIDWYAQYNTQ